MAHKHQLKINTAEIVFILRTKYFDKAKLRNVYVEFEMYEQYQLDSWSERLNLFNQKNLEAHLFIKVKIAQV